MFLPNRGEDNKDTFGAVDPDIKPIQVKDVYRTIPLKMQLVSDLHSRQTTVFVWV